jgi:hypothetical protein
MRKGSPLTTSASIAKVALNQCSVLSRHLDIDIYFQHSSNIFYTCKSDSHLKIKRRSRLGWLGAHHPLSSVDILNKHGEIMSLFRELFALTFREPWNLTMVKDNRKMKTIWIWCNKSR